MGLDQLLIFTSNVASLVLPIVGVVILVFLAIFVKRLLAVLKHADEAIVNLNSALDTANKELKALEKPLNTLNELSDTVDCVHEASKQAVRSSMVMVIENLSVIKNWVLSHMGKDASVADDAQPDNAQEVAQDEQ